VVAAPLITRDGLRQRLDTVRTIQLWIFPGGLVLGGLIPIAAWAVRSAMGPEFPESLVMPVLGGAVAIMFAAGLAGAFGGPLLVRALTPRCPTCSTALIDDTVHPDVGADGRCRRCRAQIMTAAPQTVAVGAAIADVPARLEASIATARRGRRKLLLLVTIFFVGGPLLALALPRLPLVVVWVPLIAWVVSAYIRHRNEPHQPHFSCPACGEELLSLRHGVSDAQHVLSTGVCPWCAAPLFESHTQPME